MALKDWIKDERFDNAWTSKKNFNKLLVYEGQIDNEGNQGWIAEVQTRFGGQSGLPSKSFKTKSQALSFARNYMRTH